MNFNKKVNHLKLNSITISFDVDYSGDLPIGSSKFGGCPDLPGNFQWYYYKGLSPVDNQVKERPLCFIAQINCEEVKKYDLDNRLPEKGILFFFYELETMEWGFDPQNKGCARVYYYDGDISNLVRTSLPEDMSKDYFLPEIRLTFNTKYNVPSLEELFNDNHLDLWDEYEDFLEKSGFAVDENSTKLLGYSDCVQGEMLLECELVTNGLYCGNSTGYLSPQRKELEQNRNQWKLLFQLDTVTKNDFELMFGDCGRIYYFIKEADLKNKNFDNIWLILQCG